MCDTPLRSRILVGMSASVNSKSMLASQGSVGVALVWCWGCLDLHLISLRCVWRSTTTTPLTTPTHTFGPRRSSSFLRVVLVVFALGRAVRWQMALGIYPVPVRKALAAGCLVPCGLSQVWDQVNFCMARVVQRLWTAQAFFQSQCSSVKKSKDRRPHGVSVVDICPGVRSLLRSSQKLRKSDESLGSRLRRSRHEIEQEVGGLAQLERAYRRAAQGSGRLLRLLAGVQQASVEAAVEMSWKLESQGDTQWKETELLLMRRVRGKSAHNQSWYEFVSFFWFDPA